MIHKTRDEKERRCILQCFNTLCKLESNNLEAGCIKLLNMALFCSNNVAELIGPPVFISAIIIMLVITFPCSDWLVQF